MEAVKDKRVFEEMLQRARMITRGTSIEQFKDVTFHRICGNYAALQRARAKGDDKMIKESETALEAWLYHTTERF